jgi:hypothetical protein
MDGSLHMLVENGDLVKTRSGHGVLVMRGLLKGDIHHMRAAVDRALEHARDVEMLECLVFTSHPSFRVPDAVMRYCFSHVKKYAAKFANIYFVDLPFVKRAVFHTACKALPDSLRRLVKVASYVELQSILGNDILDAVPTEDVAATPVPCDENQEVIFQFDGKKYGSGGDWGSTRCKAKTFHISSTHLWYVDKHDSRLISSTMPLDECVVEKRNVPGDMVFTFGSRSIRILASPEDLSKVCETLSEGTSKRREDGYST